MAPGSGRVRVPWGPATVTSVLVQRDGHAAGDGDGGAADARHQRTSPRAGRRRDSLSPHITEHLPAHPLLTRLAVGHESVAGGHHGHTHAARGPGACRSAWA